MDEKGDQKCPRLLDLIPNEREWKTKSDDDDVLGNGFLVSEEKKLELRLGPPGDEYQRFSADFSPSAGTKRGYSTTQGKNLQQRSGFLQLQRKAEVGKELAQQNIISGRAEVSHAAVAHNTFQTRKSMFRRIWVLCLASLSLLVFFLILWLGCLLFYVSILVLVGELSLHLWSGGLLSVPSERILPVVLTNHHSNHKKGTQR